jgi:PAS domain S-box-containing protein
MNSAAERILGIARGVAVGMPCSKVITHTDQDGRSLCDQCPMAVAMKGEAIRVETTLQIGGRLASLLITCSPLFTPDGRISGAVQVFRDISEEKEIERMKTDFVESVSHEFRTPLSAIVGMTEMLMDHAVKGPKKDEYLKTIYSEALRLSDMVSQLLDISTTEHGHIHFERELIDLNDLISSCISTYEAKKAVKDKGAVITFTDRRRDAALHPFFGDKNKLKQVIINLLDNAVTYSDDGVRVVVELDTQNKDTIISVNDSGWGVPPEDLPHIFKRFYRGRHSRTLKGTGLGLPLCEEIVKLHGGIITVESELGKGSKFVMTFPAEEGQ